MGENPTWKAVKDNFVGSKLYRAGTEVNFRPLGPLGEPHVDWMPANSLACEIDPRRPRKFAPEARTVLMPQSGMKLLGKTDGGMPIATFGGVHSKDVPECPIFKYIGAEPGFIGGELRRRPENFTHDLPLLPDEARNVIPKNAAARLLMPEAGDAA